MRRERWLTQRAVKIASAFPCWLNVLKGLYRHAGSPDRLTLVDPNPPHLDWGPRDQSQELNLPVSHTVKPHGHCFLLLILSGNTAVESRRPAHCPHHLYLPQ